MAEKWNDTTEITRLAVKQKKLLLIEANENTGLEELLDYPILYLGVNKSHAYSIESCTLKTGKSICKSSWATTLFFVVMASLED